MAQRLRPAVYVLATGYVLYFFSEFVFWSGGKPGSWSPAEIPLTWLLYSLAGFVFLAAVRLFRVRDAWGVFLAGALFGWLTEGVIVQTMYEALPLSISFTGLAWHALITVLIGWYGLRRALSAPSARPGAAISAAVGLGWGLWAVCWWVEPDGVRLSPAAFAAGALAGTTLLILAYALIDRAGEEAFRPGRTPILLAAGLFAVWFAVVAVPTAPVALLVLPPALGLVLWALRRGRADPPVGPDAPAQLAEPAGRRLLLLLLMPAVAAAVYALVYALDLRLHTNWALYLITTPLGFILLAAGVRKTAAQKNGFLEGTRFQDAAPVETTRQIVPRSTGHSGNRGRIPGYAADMLPGCLAPADRPRCRGEATAGSTSPCRTP